MSNCLNCHKLITEPWVYYGINPNAVCICRPPRLGSPSEGLKKLQEQAKDMRIAELERQLQTVEDFARLMKDLTEEPND